MTHEQQQWGALAFSAALAMSAVLVHAVHTWDRRRAWLQFVVFCNLDAALEGGQFDADCWNCDMNALAIACDLQVYAADCEGYKPTQMLPYVREWMIKQGMKP